MKRPLTSGLVLWALAAAAGCAGSAAKEPLGGGGVPCNNDAGCGNGRVCFAGLCTPRVALAPTWAFEIVPPADSPAAPTQLLSGALTEAGFTLTADRKVMVTVTVNPDPLAPTNAAAVGNLIVTSPPLIPGLPDLMFETTGPNAASRGTATVPSGLLGRPARIAIVPLPPSDRDYPPIAYDVPNLGIEHVMTLPRTVAVQGQIVKTLTANGADQPVPDFVARAYQRGQPVSNAPVSDPSGRFRLYIPEPADQNPTIVQISPLDRTKGEPWFISRSFVPAAEPTALGSLGKITFPPYLAPNFFRLPFIWEMSDPAAPIPVPGAVVRVITTLEGDPAAGQDSFVYLRDTTTDDAGLAHLTLIPTSVGWELPYRVMVTPPERSAFATHCDVTEVLFGGLTREDARVLTEIRVPRRPLLSGTILTAARIPIRNVVITATPIATPAGDCNASGALGGSATTDKVGYFDMHLDPGTYRVEYDPPPGANLTRSTIAVLSVTQPHIHLETTLNEGGVFEGFVKDAGGVPVPMATVRIFEPICDSGTAGTSDPNECFGPARTPPLLVAETQTDTQGRFRAIVPSAIPPP